MMQRYSLEIQKIGSKSWTWHSYYDGYEYVDEAMRVMRRHSDGYFFRVVDNYPGLAKMEKNSFKSDHLKKRLGDAKKRS